MLRALRPSRGNEVLMSANQLEKLAMMITLLPLLLLSYGVSHARCSTIPGNSTDMLSLLDFKRASTDPREALSSWNSSIPHCHWEGVNCSRRHPGRVTALTLAGLGLAGPISPSIGNLTLLKSLDLSRNSFSGEIPDSLTNRSRLQYLDLSANFLTGEIPHDIGLLSNLSTLLLFQNNLTGTIPPSLKNISQLSTLALGDNHLTGSIPDGLGQLPHLFSLNLGNNKLSGGIPGTLLNRSSLLGLDLSSNMLGNTLPSDIGDTLPNLQMLLLGHNHFEGKIPASLGNISGLSTLDLTWNNFTGQVPSSLGKSGMLTYLLLMGNHFKANDSQSWQFIDTLSNCSSLQELVLSQNQFQGAVPNSISKLSTKLQQLALGTNDLTGTVPAGIGNLTGLVELELRYNNLNGRIDGWVGKLKNLQGLILYANNFIGSIPSSIGELSGLTLLLVENNKFEGPIPPSLGNLPLLTRLNFGYNNLQGSIPTEIGNLKQLTELHVSSNKLTGEIPASLGNCEGLQILEMDHNYLTGNITVTLSGLQNMITLNLSHNNLSGVIPIKLADLQQLTLLDLSYNNLNGPVPTNGVFGNAKSVSLLGNWGLCGGVQGLQMPPCPTVSRTRRKETQYYLIRVLIPVFGFMSLILLVYFVITEKKTSRSKYLSLPFFENKLIKVSYEDLAQATQNFSEGNLIGRGSYGSVYRGKLMKGKIEVAVKVLDLDMHGAERSFVSECQALRGIQHRNLVPIVTACSTVDSEGNLFKALVYEFMPNGNLDRWLHIKRDEKDPKHLSLNQRINIIVNIADALDYIHNDTGSRPIIHCDVKPSNILLDDDMCAHLGDFGIASFYRGSSSTPLGDSNTSTFGVKGTIGYIAPEYATGGRASICGDVYSFGIIVLEMLTRKRPTDPMFENELNIVKFVEDSFPDQIMQVIDDALKEECKPLTPSSTVTEREVYQRL